MRATSASARACLGLQVSTVQALPLALCRDHDGWAHDQVQHILQPLWMAAPPLLSTSFEVGMQLLCTDLTTQHAASEARELAQHANQKACEDHRDAPQTFEGQFGIAKLEEVLYLLNLASVDDLPEVLHSLG